MSPDDRTIHNLAMIGLSFLVWGPEAAHQLAEKLGEKPGPMGPWPGRDAEKTPLPPAVNGQGGPH